jgi:hypothetical protein
VAWFEFSDTSAALASPVNPVFSFQCSGCWRLYGIHALTQNSSDLECSDLSELLFYITAVAE